MNEESNTSGLMVLWKISGPLPMHLNYYIYLYLLYIWKLFTGGGGKEEERKGRGWRGGGVTSPCLGVQVRKGEKQ